MICQFKHEYEMLIIISSVLQSEGLVSRKTTSSCDQSCTNVLSLSQFSRCLSVQRRFHVIVIVNANKNLRIKVLYSKRKYGELD